MSVAMQDNQQTTTEPSTRAAKDPAQVWWTDAAPKTNYIERVPIVVHEPWRWRYSWLFGIMYGPIPVGLIIGIPLLLALTMK
jgi:hypothetical protein